LPNTSSPQRAACDFCDERAGGHRNAYVDRYGESASRVILGTETFRIIPTLGQLAEGHLLVIPHDHVCALADLPPDGLGQLEDLCKNVRSILTSAYGECIFFEHGIRNDASGGCGIDHAHMHAVPVALRAAPSGVRERFLGRAIRNLSQIKTEVPDSSYIFFEDCLARRFVFPVDCIPSQHMRKLIADSIGKKEWDWRECGQEPELLSTLQQLPPLFSAAANKG
jgi:diadenosine tetraphosphate (Ap4A) HIT family hydrolase